ncbi:hypothetical protein K488DRAFT_69099 [Vararia minispora EC-137]|uniref:Uncharacterized protein n=1 Tax=Vararia minispora EC-137 TaxID=1314806 RepID=A0ACB8QS73_9AGAM|nr:hypothetical protein K488DRAFT_69099 [Vararia minispora EC-137]
MAGDVGFTNVWLVGFCLSLIYYGTYLPIFCISMNVLWKRRRVVGRPHWCMIICNTLICVLTTTNIAMQITRGYRGFSVDDSALSSPSSRLYRVNDVPAIVQHLSFYMCMVTADAIMAYRVYAIWGCNPIPALVAVALWAASLGLAIRVVYDQVNLNFSAGITPSLSSMLMMLMRDSSYVLVLTFCLNIISAGLISWRIWRLSPPSNCSLSRKAIEVFVGSAVGNGAHLLVLIVARSFSARVYVLFYMPLTPLVALVFSSILARVTSELEHAILTPNDPSAFLPADAVLAIGRDALDPADSKELRSIELQERALAHCCCPCHAPNLRLRDSSTHDVV